MRRWWLAAGASGVVIVVLAVVAAVLALRGGISARPAPSPLEARLARTLRGWAIPADARRATNPIPAGPRAIEEGLAHFADHCATCHANDGSGDTAIGRGLYPRASDLRRETTQRLTDGELFYLIENGVRFTGMPAWGGPGTAEESWHLVRFIRHLQDLTDEERERMEALNPKSPDEWRALEDEDAFLRGEQPKPSETEHAHHSH
jgi:mono/diheme cytochrome c family protein